MRPLSSILRKGSSSFSALKSKLSTPIPAVLAIKRSWLRVVSKATSLLVNELQIFQLWHHLKAGNGEIRCGGKSYAFMCKEVF